MSDRLIHLSNYWFKLWLRFYPPDFRDEMGDGVVDAYRHRVREAFGRGGVFAIARVWIHMFSDSVRNGLGERARPAASWRRSGNWGRDTELTMRRLVRSPASALAMIVTLTVGLGMFAVVYTVIDKILIQPMPYKDPQNLYFVWRDYGPIFDLKRGWLGGTDVAELQKGGNIIESSAGLLRNQMNLSQRAGADTSEIAVMVISPNLFEVLGVSPMLGRVFTPAEAGPGRPRLVVLTHALWSRLGADPAIVGSDVRLNEQPFTVIGVMPRNFAFARNSSLGPPEPADAYITSLANLAATNPNAGSYAGLIRARAATSPQTVASAVDAVGRAIDARDFKSRGLRLYPVGLKADLVARVRPALIVLGFAAAFLVLVLMVNLASVLLARAAQREHEFAVSRALGANSLAVVRATLLEGGVLGLIGGIGGALGGFWGTRMLVALAPLDLPRREAVVLDWRIASVVVGVGALMGLLAAAAPAAWASRASLSSLLASSAVRGGGGHGTMRRGMVVAQVALSLLLLTTGGLVVRSFQRLLHSDPGINPNGVLTLRVPMPPPLYPMPADVLALQERIQTALRSIPGVSGVSAVDALPLTNRANQTTITIPSSPGITGNKEQDSPLVDYIGTRAGYVETIGMRLVAGRAFETVRHENAREALIDTHLAKQFFPTGNPLGAKIPFRDGELTVVGVVEQTRLYDVHQDGRPQLFVRAEDWGYYNNLSYVVRSSRDSQSLVPDVRAALRQIDPRLALSQIKTMNEIIDDALRQQRVSAVLIGGFALGALLLAAMGLFGIVANSVMRRRHELAVRLALGADHDRVLHLVLGEGARLIGLGVLISLPGIYALGSVLRSVLVGISPADPLTLAAVTLGLSLVALAACYLPARRVLSIDPAQSLRGE